MKQCEQVDAPGMGKTQCVGYPKKKIVDGSVDLSLINWLRALAKDKKKWGPSAASRRKPAQGVEAGFLEVRAIDNPRGIALQDLKKHSRGLVMAVIFGDRFGVADARYGLGESVTANMEEAFFLVVDEFKVTTQVPGKDSYQIGSWTLYGITKDASAPRLKAVRKGELHFCVDSLTSVESDITARLNGCQAAHRLLALERAMKPALKGKSLVDAAFAGANRVQLPASVSASEFVALVANSFDGPAWMQCGTGCCTFEGGLDVKRATPAK